MKKTNLIFLALFIIAPIACTTSKNNVTTKPSALKTTPTPKSTPTPSPSILAEEENENGLLLTYEDKDGKTSYISKNQIKSYQVGEKEYTDFGACSTCPTLEEDIIIYKGTEPLTFNLKVQETKETTSDVSVVIPYNIYQTVDEDYSYSGLIYTIKQKNKTDEDRFSAKAVDNNLIFEIVGGTLDKTTNEVSTIATVQYSDEEDISVFTKDGKINKFKFKEIKKANPKPFLVRAKTKPEDDLLLKRKDRINTVVRPLVKPKIEKLNQRIPLRKQPLGGALRPNQQGGLLPRPAASGVAPNQPPTGSSPKPPLASGIQPQTSGTPKPPLASGTQTQPSGTPRPLFPPPR